MVIPALIDATGERDATDQLNAWLASIPAGGVAEFGKGVYRVDGTVRVVEKSLSIKGNGATLRRVTDSADRDGAVLAFYSGRDISIRNLTIDGGWEKAGIGSEAWTPNLEGQHGLAFFGVDGVKLDHVEVHHTHGDLLYLGYRRVSVNGSVEVQWCRHVHVAGSDFHHSGRHGLSFQAARCVIVEESYVGDTRFSTLEFEPLLTARNGAEHVYVVRNDFGPGRLMFLSAAGSGPVNDITIADNRLARRMDVLVHDMKGGRRSGWNIERNVSLEATSNPSLVMVQATRVDGLRIVDNVQPTKQRGRPMSDVMFMARLSDCTDWKVEGNDLSPHGLGQVPKEQT